jgi:hypothetical protein
LSVIALSLSVVRRVCPPVFFNRLHDIFLCLNHRRANPDSTRR